nr:response regulator [Cytophagales bacterium]
MKDIIRIVSVNNEVHAWDTLQHIIENNIEGAHLVKSYSKPDSFLQEWKAGMHDFDLLFLDFEIYPLNGIDLIKKMKKISSRLHFDTVFLTSNDNFALEAVRNHAIDYLHKPYRSEEIQFCLKKWKKTKLPFVNPIENQLPQQSPEKPKKARNRLAIPTLEGYEIIEIDQIIRCEADRNYSYIYLIGVTQPLLISRNLKDLETALSSNGFLRIHNSHLINPIYIKKILRTDGGMIELIDHTKIMITKNKVMTVEELFNNITKL